MPRKTSGFLIDRCLTPRFARGVNYFSDAERRRIVGAFAAHLDDIYPGRAEELKDPEWLADVGANGWSALTQDTAILTSGDEFNAMISNRTRVFSLSTANLTNEGKGMMFGRWWLPVLRRTLEPGPCFWRLYPGSITKDVP